MSNINEETFRSHYLKNADSDNNDVLDIFEFINFLSKHDNLRNDFLKILTKTKEKKKLETHVIVFLLFSTIYQYLHIRNNWRPSLADLKSPTQIIHRLQFLLLKGDIKYIT